MGKGSSASSYSVCNKLVDTIQNKVGTSGVPTFYAIFLFTVPAFQEIFVVPYYKDGLNIKFSSVRFASPGIYNG